MEVFFAGLVVVLAAGYIGYRVGVSKSKPQGGGKPGKVTGLPK